MEAVPGTGEPAVIDLSHLECGDVRSAFEQCQAAEHSLLEHLDQVAQHVERARESLRMWDTACGVLQSMLVRLCLLLLTQQR